MVIANYGYQDGSGEYYITIDTDKCNSCGKCVDVCPKDVFEMITDDYDELVLRNCLDDIYEWKGEFEKSLREILKAEEANWETFNAMKKSLDRSVGLVFANSRIRLIKQILGE